jgi:hypothetical protein
MMALFRSLFVAACFASAHAFHAPPFALRQPHVFLRVASFDSSEFESAAETPLAKPLGTLTEYYKRVEAAKKSALAASEPLVSLTDPGAAERLNGRLAMMAWAVILLREAFGGFSVADQFNELAVMLHL